MTFDDRNINNTVSAGNMESNASAEMPAVGEKPLNSSSFMEQLEAVAESVQAGAAELRGPSEEVRSPTPQQRNVESSSVYHTPEVFSSPMPVRDLDLAKVRTALSELNAVVKEEEEHFFHQLSAAESENTQLRQHVAGIEELKETNLKLKKSVEAAQIMMGKLRTESQSRLTNLSETLVTKDVEIAKLQAEYKVMSESKETEMALMRKLLEAQEEEAKKLRLESKTSSESLIAQETALAHLRQEFQTLQAAFDAIKAEKDEIEQGHEDAKEKWKKLVITMKSEYDNFRQSFEHLKASKKAMEETHAAEKNALEQETFKLRAENGSLSAAMDSMKICKEVADNEYREARQTWEKNKDEMESELSRLRVENGTLSKYNEEIDEKYTNLNSQMDDMVRERVEPTEKKFNAIMEEFGNLKSEMYSLQLSKQDVELENADLKNKNEELTTERNNANEELKLEREQHAALKSKHDELTCNHETKVSECDALRTELDLLLALQTDHESLTERFETLKAEHQELIKEKVGADERIASLESDNEAMSEAQVAASAELEEIKAKLAAVEEEKATVEKTLEEVRAEAQKTLEEAKAAFEKTLEETKAAAEKTLEEEKAAAAKALEEEKAAAAKALEEEKAAAEKALEEERAIAETKVNDIKLELDIITIKHENLTGTLEGVRIAHKDEKQKFEKKIAKLNKAVETKKEALSLGLAKYLKELKAKEKAEKELNALKSKNEENEELIKKHVADLEGADKRIAALEDVIKFKDADHKKALAKLNEKVEESLNYEATKREAALKAQVEAENKLAEKEKLMAEAAAEAENKLAEQEKLMAKRVAMVQEEADNKLTEMERLMAKAEEEAEIKLTEKDKLVAKTEAEILAAKCRGDSLREELEKAEAGRQEAIANTEQVSKVLEDTKKALEETKEECETLRGSLASARFDNKKAKEQADEMQHQINTLNKSVAKKIAAITALESKCETLKNTIDVSASSGIETEQKIGFLNEMVSNKEKELELLKNHCASLQISLGEAEEKLKEKTALKKAMENAEYKITESSMLIDKKNSELQSLQERCDKLQTALKKAEALYLDGVENIKTEAERKQREALEEATDRAYVLKGLLAKKEEELVALREANEKLKSCVGDAEGGMTEAEAEVKRGEEFKSLTNKINFLDEMVSSKDSELELVKARCVDLQESIRKMQEAHEKQIELIKEESEKEVTKKQMEKEMELTALNREIAQKQAKLKSLNEQEEFEIVLDNGDEDRQLLEEVEALRARCNKLEQELDKAEGKSVTLEAAMNAGSAAAASEQWQLRCTELEASLQKMTKQYEEEQERRKEAEQVFTTLSERSNDFRPPRSTFGRNRPTPETSDASTKKSSRWLGLRGRKKRDDLSVRTDSEEYYGIGASSVDEQPPSPSKWRSQYSPYSPRRTTPRGATVTEGIIPEAPVSEKERILALIPTHIKSNFYEVGIYKQRLQSSYVPVLCLSPFDVPKGPIRDDWLSKFDGRNSKVLSLGVYFLGKDADEEGAYGTIPWFSFVPYNKAVQRGFDQIPKAIADKIEAGEALSREEQQVCDGMKTLKQAAAMNKEERTHPLKSQAQAEGEIPKTIVTDSSNEDDQVSEMGV